MLFEIARELGDELAAHGCPLRVVYGPERAEPTTFGDERIVVERVLGGDTFGPPIANHRNPRVTRTRLIGAKITIYVRSPLAGAAIQDHHRRADLVVDALLSALDVVVRVNRKSGYELNSGGFAVPADLEDSSTWGGAMYVIDDLKIQRAAESRAWPTLDEPEGAIAETVPLPGITSRTVVRMAGADPSAPGETSCGG